jgi:hypothetical protein
MRYGWCAILCLATFSPFAVAQTLDKAKLRQTIEMPAVNTSLGVQYRSQERDGRGNKFDAVQKIADLQKKLTGGPDDASVYLEQHALYLECLKDDKKAKELAAKAEAVLRPITKTKDPKEGYLLTVYATVIETLSENPWSQCEAWARYAVSVAPQDWRTWVYLAHTRQQQLPTILIGGDDKLLTKHRRTQEILAALYQRRLRSEHVDAAEKVLDETLKYHDKAKELAPNEAKRQEQRYGFRFAEITLRNAICVYRSQKPTYPLSQIERVLLDELQETARVQPDHLLWQSQCAHQLIVAGWYQHQDNAGKLAKVFRPARPEDMKAIQAAMDRIEALANDGKGETSVYCRSMLAALCASMQDHAGAEKHARKMLELDPKNQPAAEQLQQSLLQQDRKTDQLQAAQTLAETTKSARNCFLLAKALVLNGRFDLAEQTCLAGLKLDANDVHCLLGVAALAMRKSDDAASLKLAQDLLDKARRELRPEAGMQLFIEHEYLASIHQALTGEAVFARLKLDKLRTDFPDVPRYEKALAAIGR